MSREHNRIRGRIPHYAQYVAAGDSNAPSRYDSRTDVARVAREEALPRDLGFISTLIALKKQKGLN